jgi:hypothetical protein
MIAKYVMGNRSSSASLSDYVKQEINALEGNTYFELLPNLEAIMQHTH